MNNKGRFKDNDPKGNKFKSFMKESGFYIAIVVGLCVLAAGVVYFSTNQILKDPDAKPPIAGDDLSENGYEIGLGDAEDPLDDFGDQSSIDWGSDFSEDNPYIGMEDFDLDPEDNEMQVDNDPEEQADKDVKDNKEDNKDGEKEDKDSKTSGQDPSVTTSGETDFFDDSATEDVVLAIVRPAFKPPMSGKIQSEYSMDKLVFSPTFNEWRTHSGVDIAAPRGEVVRSIGDGKVLEVKNDPRYGFTVVIDHNNGYKSIYSNLASDQTIQIGQEVKLGDPIGAVGATAIFESAEPTHLHLELYKENKLVDPAAYIDFN
ncbi:MAG: peptidoglycan DD-metalloendopeptidase family protein [Acetivibrionales bacterium]